MRSREEKELEERAGAFAGNAASRNAQMGTDTAIDSMQELLYKAGKISKVGFDQSKGNLFEYIEAAKLQKNMANRGEYFDRNPVTDLAADRGGYGGHIAPDDFRMQKNGRIVGRGQAKYNNSPRRAAQNFVNPKYTDMQRIAPTDQMTDIESCLQEMYSDVYRCWGRCGYLVAWEQFGDYLDFYEGIFGSERLKDYDSIYNNAPTGMETDDEAGYYVDEVLALAEKNNADMIFN